MTTAEQALAAVARLRKIHVDALDEIAHSGHCRVKWLEFVGSSQDSHAALLDAVEVLALLVSRLESVRGDPPHRSVWQLYFTGKSEHAKWVEELVRAERALAKLAEVVEVAATEDSNGRL